MTERFEYFGKYLLLEKLATGGMAEVFLARSQAAGGISKFVAVKRILPQYAESPEFIDMFKDEAKIAVNLSHSNIVSIYDFGVQSNQFYLVMDYVEGRNLRQILNKIKKTPDKKLSVDQIVYAIKEVAAGLDHAHRCHDGATGHPLNITHRDMSPQNVMVSFEGEIKIVDFGIAKAESQLETTRAGTLKGKFGYMSPEQAEGQPVDLRTDIFSLGIVLWELLANDRLFVANNEVNTLRKIRDCQVPSLRKINPNLPAELERITMKALARDRNLRYQTAAAMHRDLNRFLNRQYPEFSPQDFAGFIKNLFSEEIFSTRRRLVEYSKIPVADVVDTGAARQGPAKPANPTLSADTNSFVSAKSSGDIMPSNQDGQSNSGTPAQTFSGSDINFNADTAPKGLSFSTPSLAPKGSEDPTRLSHDVSSNIGTGADPGTNSNTGALGLDEKALRKESNRARAKQSFNQYVLETEEASQPNIRGRTVSRSGIHAGQLRPPPPSPAGKFLTLVVGGLLVVSGYLFLAKYYGPTMQPVVNALDPYIRPLHVAFGLHSKTADNNDTTGALSIASTTPVKKPDPAVQQQQPQPQPPNPTPTPNPTVNPTPGPQPFVAQKPTPIEPPPPPVIEAPPTPVIPPGVDPEPVRPDEPIGQVLVSSNPSGADILINGRSTGLISPSKVDVPTKRPFVITLRRQGFLDYRKENLSFDTIGIKFVATLQPALIGYLDIDVIPPQNIKVFVNGRQLKGEHLPISGYAVPAETPITVRAEDPYSQAYAQQVVRVQKDGRIQVRLDLRKSMQKNDRLPSRVK